MLNTQLANGSVLILRQFLIAHQGGWVVARRVRPVHAVIRGRRIVGLGGRKLPIGRCRRTLEHYVSWQKRSVVCKQILLNLRAVTKVRRRPRRLILRVTPQGQVHRHCFPTVRVSLLSWAVQVVLVSYVICHNFISGRLAVKGVLRLDLKPNN